MADAPKRAHDPSTGQTPGKTQPKRRSTTSGRFLKRSLFSNAEKEQNVRVEKDQKERVDAWSDRETAALVEYIALFHSSNEDPSSIWPTSKNDEFWGKCADAVNCYNVDKKRTGIACRSKVGQKAFHDVFPKVISEYTKKCDPDLPFYYYTGSNDRFNDGSLASFNVPSSTGEERLDRVRISRRADPGVFVANRAVIPQRGQLSVRSAHFKPAESLPPPPPPSP